jgi:riboflavin biosynthesis pyrimidine reductase
VAQGLVLFYWVAAARLAVGSVMSMRVVSERHLRTHSNLQQLHEQRPLLTLSPHPQPELREWSGKLAPLVTNSRSSIQMGSRQLSTKSILDEIKDENIHSLSTLPLGITSRMHSSV